jgi:hypothetical protein
MWEKNYVFLSLTTGCLGCHYVSVKYEFFEPMNDVILIMHINEKRENMLELDQDEMRIRTYISPEACDDAVPVDYMQYFYFSIKQTTDIRSPMVCGLIHI